MSNDGDGEGADNLEESQSETDDNETDDDIDGDGSAELSENKMDDNDVNNVKGSDDKALVSATVNMDLEMTDDDDDEEEEDKNATIEASDGADSGIANDESISDSDVCDGEGGGDDGCGSASAIAASATAASATADSPENFSSHPSSKHEKSKSSSSVPSSFKAPICIGSIPLKKLKLTHQEMEKIKQNVSAKTMPLKCSTPLLSLAAVDCHHDGKCYAHQLMYSNKSKINHSVMIRQIMTKPRAGKK